MADSSSDSSNDTPVVLISGAGSGIGRDCALLMAEAGYAVAAVGRTGSKLADTQTVIRDELEQETPFLTIEADLSTAAACDDAVARTVERFGRIDALANIAGVAPVQPIERIDEAVFDHAVDNNLKHAVFLTRAAWPHFKKQRSGAVCSVSAMAVFNAYERFNIYAAAKAGVQCFAHCVATEGARLNITSSSVAPGAVETSLLRGNFSTKAIPEENALDPLIVAGVIRDLLTGKRAHEPGECIQIPSPK